MICKEVLSKRVQTLLITAFIGLAYAEEPPAKGTICDHLDNDPRSVSASFTTEDAIDYIGLFIDASANDDLTQTLVSEPSDEFKYQQFCTAVCNNFHFGDQAYKKGVCEGHAFNPNGNYKVSKKNGLCAYAAENSGNIMAVLRQAFAKDQKAFFMQAAGVFDPVNKTFTPSSNKERVNLYSASGVLHSLNKSCQAKEAEIKTAMVNGGWSAPEPVGNEVCVDLFKNLYIVAYTRVIERLENGDAKFCKALCKKPQSYTEDICRACSAEPEPRGWWQRLKAWWG